MGKKLNDCKLKLLFYHGLFVLNTFCHFYVGIDSEIYGLFFKTHLLAVGKNTQEKERKKTLEFVMTTVTDVKSHL